MFKSLVDAREELLQLLLGQYTVFNMNENQRAESLGNLDRWSHKLDHLLAGISISPGVLTPSERRTVALLRLHRRDTMISLLNFTSGESGLVRDTMAWDDFTDEFNKMLHDAAVALGLDRDSQPQCPDGDAPQFHLEFGVMTAILSVAGRCRDPLVRRKALCLILAAPAQEGIWSSKLVAMVARRVIDMEESGRVVYSGRDVPREARLNQLIVVLGYGEKRAKIQFTFPYGLVEEWIEWQ